MTHTYNLTGMTCGSCEAKVKNNLLKLPYITEVTVSKEDSTATISMEKHINTKTLQQALDPKYTITQSTTSVNPIAAESWLHTYKPLLILFGYIIVFSCIGAFSLGKFEAMNWMRLFMAGFFIAFSFFKMLDLKGFAESYSMYDIIAKRFRNWGYVYAFLELGLGITLALNFQPIAINIITLIVMSLSIIGVLQSVFQKKTIKCACLGTVFNLPMSTVTIVEDSLMIAMSVFMLLSLA